MPQPYRTSALPRQAPSRSPREASRSAARSGSSAADTTSDPPVLLQLPDYSQLAARRMARRLTNSKGFAAKPLAVPPVWSREPVSDPADAIPEPQDSKRIASPVAEKVAIAAEKPVRLETPPAAAVATASPPAAAASATPAVTETTVTGAAPAPPLGSEDPAANFWDRAFAYRPSLPLLLGLVLATICVAYIYRPQETPPSRRGSPETTGTKRRFESQYDDQRPKAMSAQTGIPHDNPADLVLPVSDDMKMPKLDMPANSSNSAASTNTNTADAGSTSPAKSSPGDSLPGPGNDLGPQASEANSRTRLATRPAPTEHFESTPPPRMPESPQVQADNAPSGDEEEGPPPDISGQTYPQTNPQNFFYRPTTPETREANRPSSPLGGTR